MENADILITENELNTMTCGICASFSMQFLQRNFSDWYIKHLQWIYPDMNATEPHQWLVNIGLGNGLETL